VKVLGFGGPFFLHDPAAAILIDGKVVAAAEEERFIRSKHAVGKPCRESIKFCLKQAGLKPGDIDAAAFPWSFEAFDRKKWVTFSGPSFEPSRAYKVIAKSAGRTEISGLWYFPCSRRSA